MESLQIIFRMKERTVNLARQRNAKTTTSCGMDLGNSSKRYLVGFSTIELLCGFAKFKLFAAQAAVNSGLPSPEDVAPATEEPFIAMPTTARDGAGASVSL